MRLQGSPFERSDRDFEESCLAQARPGDAAMLSGLWVHRHLLLLVCDLLVIVSSFLAAYYLRFSFELGTSVFPFQTPEIPGPTPYFKIALITGLVWVFLLWKDGNYRKDLYFLTPAGKQIRSILVSGFVTMVLIVVISFMYRYFLLSRVTYITAFILAGGILIVARWFFSLIERRLSKLGVIVNRVLFLGNGPSIKTISLRLQELDVSSLIIGRLLPQRNECTTVEADFDAPALGTVAELERIYAHLPFNQLIIGSYGNAENFNEGFSNAEIISAVNFCEERNVPVYMVPDFLEVMVRRNEVGSLAGVPLIRLQDSSLHPAYFPVKRLMDISISLCVLVLGMPLWLAIALLIKLTSKGPVFYVQERAGLHGQPFSLLKFRSMVAGADKMLKNMVNFDALKEPVFNIRQDPRVTRVGHILRFTSLDEIPQLINVLMGSMSIVGPRPERVELVEKYNPCQRRRLKAKPGITGYQQVMSRGDPSLARRIEYDLYYMKYQSLLLDLYIMFRTILVIVKGEGMK